jgi:hypothetical protein
VEACLVKLTYYLRSIDYGEEIRVQGSTTILHQRLASRRNCRASSGPVGSTSNFGGGSRIVSDKRGGRNVSVEEEGSNFGDCENDGEGGTC